MTSTVKKMVYGSLAVAGIVGLLCLIDLVMGVPFGGQTTLDICMIISSLVMGYMGFTIKKEQS